MLSDEEKSKIIKGLTQKRGDLITTLNKLPFTNQTVSMRENKSKIEREIDEVENAVRMLLRAQEGDGRRQTGIVSSFYDVNTNLIH
jgi:hypothetical protein